jgi:opacity protein-like surface antigen
LQGESCGRRSCLFCILLFVAFVLGPAVGAVSAQTNSDGAFYSRRNTFGFFGAYSRDSSHMLLGYAEKRELLDIGASWSRRLILNRVVNWQYSVEVLPVALESDPTVTETVQFTEPVQGTTSTQIGAALVTCTPVTFSFNGSEPNGEPYSYTETDYCSGRRWTIGEAISPVGFQWNFRPRRKMQPFVDGHGGYMYSTKPIPVYNAGSFNFTFDLGAGLELYRSRARSIRAEYRYHHISNHNTAFTNPGIDNGLFQVTYCFGR